MSSHEHDHDDKGHADEGHCCDDDGCSHGHGKHHDHGEGGHHDHGHSDALDATAPVFDPEAFGGVDISGDGGLVSPAAAEMLCGGGTGVVYNLLCSPLDVVRSRLMATSSGGVWSHARDVLREHGALRGFFRGADVTVLKAFRTNSTWASSH